MNALEIKNLCKTYKSGFSLKNFSLTLPSGCILGLIGENGAGKSTVIKIILDMIKKDSGNISILGKDGKENIKIIKEDIGVVLDNVGISGCLNTKQVGKIMKYTFMRWDMNMYESLLEKLSVPKNKPFKDFSNGMRMKLGIAIAMSHNAKLLILDEATNGLDPVVRNEIIEMIGEFTRDENHSVLMCSHIVSDLEKVCDYIAFLHNGELMLCEEKDRLTEKYVIIRTAPGCFLNIDNSAVIGKRESKYGVEAIVERESAPDGAETSPVDLEKLFIFMSKEAK